jgi:hypothetical protein
VVENDIVDCEECARVDGVDVSWISCLSETVLLPRAIRTVKVNIRSKTMGKKLGELTNVVSTYNPRESGLFE